MATREELIAAEEQAWQELHALTGSVTAEEWDRPGCTGDWSPKHVLAHIACWAAEGARQLECIRAGAPSKGPETESFNAESHEACKDLSVAETLAMAAAAHHRLREELEVVAPVALGGRTVEMIRENSDRHYREHAEQIRVFLGRES